MEAIDIFFARILAALAISIFCLAGTACHAKKPPAPQYVNVAPLPGSGLALDSEGKADGQGAMQINIPVAYTPGADFAGISAYAGQFARRDKSHPDWANGTGTLAFGFGKWPRVYGSAMAVSSLIWTDSKVLSGQMQVVKETERSPAIAIGAQDILNKEQKDFGATSNTGVSYYAVATKTFRISDHKVYGTLGYGAARFLDRPFVGLSAPINNQVSFATEYDGYQINAAVGWRPWGRYSPATLLAGWNGRCGALAGAQVTGKVSGWWAIPAMCLLIRH